MDPWGPIKTDREHLADYLEGLPPEDWDAPSLCEGWSVKDVTLHLLLTPTVSKGKIFFAFVGSGFNLDKMSQKHLDKVCGEYTPEKIVAKTRETAGVQSAPPGLKPIGVLGEVLTHSSDIALALDKPIDLPVEHYVLGLEHYQGVQPVLGCKARIEGLTLTATDADWSHGTGPEVRGDAQHLLAAMTGRTKAIDELSGDGVETLRSRG